MANIVDIIVRSKDQTRPGFSSAKGEAKGFQGSLQRIGETAAGFLSANLVQNAAQRVKDFVAGSISAASDLNESISKSGVIFGQNQGKILDWSRSSAQAMGISQQAAIENAATFGNLFEAIGLTKDQAAGMSPKLIQLAADLASFNNADPTQVLQDMQSGLTGQVEPMRKYGVSLTDAALKQEALRLGLIKSTKGTLPDAIKTQAAYSLMLRQTKTAQGDFARTSDGLANSQRIANAQWENARARIGTGLLPVMKLATNVMAALGKVMSEHPGLVMALAAVVGGVLVAAFTAWAISAGTAAVATLAAAAPILGIIAVVALLVAGIILLARNWRTIWDAIKRAAGAAAGFIGAQLERIGNAAGAVLGWIRGHWPLLLAILVGPIGAAVIAIIRHWDKIRSGVVTAFHAVVAFVKAVPGRILAALGNLGGLLLDAGRQIIEGLIRGITDKLGALGSALRAVGSFIAEHKGPRSRDLRLLQPAGQAIMEGLQTGIAARVPALGHQLGGITSGIGASARGTSGGPTLAAAGGPMVLEIRSGGSHLDDLLVEVLRRAVRARGGNVQAVLGS